MNSLEVFVCMHLYSFLPTRFFNWPRLIFAVSFSHAFSHIWLSHLVNNRLTISFSHFRVFPFNSYLNVVQKVRPMSVVFEHLPRVIQYRLVTGLVLVGSTVVQQPLWMCGPTLVKYWLFLCRSGARGTFGNYGSLCFSCSLNTDVWYMAASFDHFPHRLVDADNGLIE